MPYDPIAKKAYDKERNAKLKQDYMNANPSYVPTRTQDKKRIEDRKSRYVNSSGISVRPQENGYNPFNDAYETQQKYVKTQERVNRPNNGIEADRKKPKSYDEEFDAYGEDETSKPKPKFNIIQPSPQYYNTTENGVTKKQAYSFV
jgi:hypothetical protein